MRTHLIRIALTALSFSFCAAVRAAGPKDAVVIVYATFADSSSWQIGTGAFVDHDGLILTADHVVRRISVSTPSAFVNGKVSAVQPTSITIYSALLNAKISIDLSKPDSVVGGQISDNQWLDIALIRASLTDAQKLQLQPLDLSINAPSQTDGLEAYGPLCTTQDSNCYIPSSVKTTLSSDPATSRAYQVHANITPGYSGGPLVNDSGYIVGIASFGDVIANTVVSRASYVPSPYIARFFFSRIPPPSALTQPNACTAAQAMPFLTAFDWAELSSRWASQATLLQTPDQCQCCCQSLDKTKNAVGAPASSTCTPPFCAQQRMYGNIGTVTVAIETDSVDESTAKAYSAMKVAISQIDTSTLGSEQQTKLYGDIATAFARVARSKGFASDPAFKDAPRIALSALARLQSIAEVPINYVTMASMFLADGDEVDAAKANILGSVITLPEHTVLTELKIDPATLRASVNTAALTRGAGFSPVN